MFGRFHSLIALLSVALHLLDLVVAAGHTHRHGPGDACATACASQAQPAACSSGHDHHSDHRHGHEHNHDGHSHAAPCGPAPCDPTESHPDSKPHHDCAICQHLALTPALVSPASPALSLADSEPVVGEVASLLPPLRIVECRSRAPPASLA